MRRGPVRMVVAGAAILALTLPLTPPAVLAGALASTAYPSAACPSTLGNCVASMAPGGVLRIVTNSTITEDITLKDSLTLSAATGFRPTIDGDIEISSATGSQSITVQGLTVHGQVSADMSGAAVMSSDSAPWT